MSKIYLKNNYFNNHSISIHLAENNTHYFIEQDVCGIKSQILIKKTRANAYCFSRQKYSDQSAFIQKIIDSTLFNTSAASKKISTNKIA